jgi:pimeloyl-ACP methyl ester carboxylesterase
MNVIERGEGPPLVVIPGLQGRWAYIRPAIEGLSASFRVITFDLCDEPSSAFAFKEALGFQNYVDQVRVTLDRCGIERSIVCGISFGGLVALHFASSHPDRTERLVLTSTPGPGWHLRRRHEIYARLPYVFGPVFLAETPLRLRRELAAAFPDRLARWRFAGSQLALLVRAPLSIARMADRARLISTIDMAADCSRITAPTLIVSGERGLDHVVSVDGSIGYLSKIRGSRSVVLERSGHLGAITRPAAFAAAIRDFAAGPARDVA